MNEQELMKFVIERSNDPIIKNPVLRDAMNKDLGPRNMYSQGQLVSNTVDGSRPGYAGALTAKQQQKIIEAFPDTVFDFDTYPMSGAKKYLTSDQNKANPDHTKVERFKKKGFTLEMGKGLNTRGVPYSKEGKRLSIKDQNKIKAKYDLPEGIKEWDFKTYKYGIKSGGRENLLSRMARTIAEKGKWTLAADFGGPKGWMLAQMQRVYKNETAPVIGPDGEPTGKRKVKKGVKLTYDPKYAEISGQDRIVGFKDNTAAGQGKTYYGLDKYTKKNAGDWTQHGDWKLNKKLIDISKRSKNAPNEVIMGILKDKGFTGNTIKLNDLIHFLSGTEEGSLANVKNAVVRHHNSGVKFGSATNDLSLTTSIINKRIVEAETRIAAGNILPEDVQLLRNNNVYVRGANDKLYGAGKKSPIGQFKQIEKSVADSLESGVDFKGNKFKIKSGTPLHNKLMKFCPKDVGGTAGVCSLDEAMRGMKEESKMLQSGKLNKPQSEQIAKKFNAVRRVGTGLAKGSKLMSWLGPYGLGGEIALEGMFVANDMLENGMTYKEALSNSVLRYALPKNQREKLEYNEDRNRKILGNDTKGLAADYVSGLKKQEDLIKSYNKFNKMNETEGVGDIDGSDIYDYKDIYKAEKDFGKDYDRMSPTYGKNIFDIVKYGSPEQQAFAAKEEGFDVRAMENRMEYDKKLLGPLGKEDFYSQAQLDMLDAKALSESKKIGQRSNEIKTQEVANFGGVANRAEGGIMGIKRK